MATSDDIHRINGVDDQLLGRIVVKTSGRGLNGTNADTEAQYIVDIALESGRYDDRFNDPRYYTGDAIT
jgi:hypothetical protein